MKRAPGEGTVTRTASGTYRVRVRDGHGRRRDLGTYGTEAEAEAARNEALRALATARIPATGVTTLRAWGESWLARRDARGVDAERSVWRRHVVAHLGDLPLHDVTRAAVTRWLEVLRRTPAAKARAGGKRGAVEVLTLAAAGEPVPRALTAELARVALAVGCDAATVARMLVAGPSQARAVVEIAAEVAATMDAARAAGG